MQTGGHGNEQFGRRCIAMTESDWLQEDDPHLMIQFLHEERTHFRTRWLGWMAGPRRYQVSERKWRLFYCACCRRIEHLLPVDESRLLLDVAECYADGKASEDELGHAVAVSRIACEQNRTQRGFEGVAWPWHESEAVNAIARFHRSDEQGRLATLRAAARAWASAVFVERFRSAPPTLPEIQLQTEPSWEAEQGEEHARQAALLRDVLGNPFRVPVLDPAWGAWEAGTVVRIARSIYEERRFENLPILADALEDAGCGDEAILDHCRSATEHVRGCWLMDLILERS
jgi:hypothetical protein